MKILINTSEENVEIGGETFIPGEWLHLSDEFKVDAKSYPFIKAPQTILAERYPDVKVAPSKEILQFAEGIKQAEIAYKWKADILTSEVLTAKGVKYADK